MVKPGTSHRATLVMKGPGLSDKVSDSDPHKPGVKPWKIRALDGSKEALFTAEILNEFIEKAHKILDMHPLNFERRKKGLLPANLLLIRGVGKMKKVPGMRERFGLKACCIAGAGLYKGVAAFAGMKVLNVKGATGTPKTDLMAKFARAVKEIGKYDFEFVHIKGCDVFGHDGDAIGKKRFIEKIDRAIAPLLVPENTIVAVTADHSTPCSFKDHSADPVPVLLFGPGIKPDSAKKFGERPCRKGSLGEIQGKDFMKLLIKAAGRE